MPGEPTFEDIAGKLGIDLGGQAQPSTFASIAAKLGLPSPEPTIGPAYERMPELPLAQFGYVGAERRYERLPNVIERGELPPQSEWMQMGRRGVAETLAPTGAARKRYEEVIPLAGMAFSTARTQEVQDAMKFLQDYESGKRIPPDPYQPGRNLQKEAQQARQKVEDFIVTAGYMDARQPTGWAQVASGIIDVIPYVAEFMLTSGMSQAVHGTVTAIAKKLALKYGKHKLTRVGIGAGAAMFKPLASGAIRTALIGGPRILEQTQRRMASDFGFGPEGKLVVTRLGDAALDSLIRSIGNVGISYTTEELGGFVDKGLGKVLKGLVKLTGAQKSKLLTGLVNYMNRHTARIAEIGRLPGEYAEERLEGLGHYIFGVDEFGLSKQEVSALDAMGFKLPDTEAFWVEMGVLLGMQAGGATLQYTAKKLMTDQGARQLIQTSPELAEVVIENPTRTTFEGIGIKKTSVQERKEAAEKIEATWNRDTRRAAAEMGQYEGGTKLDPVGAVARLGKRFGRLPTRKEIMWAFEEWGEPLENREQAGHILQAAERELAELGIIRRKGEAIPEVPGVYREMTEEELRRGEEQVVPYGAAYPGELPGERVLEREAEPDRVRREAEAGVAPVEEEVTQGERIKGAEAAIEKVEAEQARIEQQQVVAKAQAEQPKVETTPPAVVQKPDVPKQTVLGAETEIEVAGYDKPVPAKYAIVPLKSLTASHEMKAGVAVSNIEKGLYPPGVQPRTYTLKSTEHAEVIDHALKMVTGYWISDHPDPTNGPPMVTSGGIVLNGNGRTMSLQEAVRRGTYQKYKTDLTKKAGQFGLDAADVKRMKHPVLVRITDIDPRSAEARRMAPSGNVSSTVAQSPVRTGAALAGMVDMDIIDKMKLDEDTTFSEAVTSDNRASGFRETLRRELPPKVAPQFFSPEGRLTEAGIELVRNMLLTNVLPIELVERLGAERKGLKRSLEGIIPQLLKMKRGFSAYDIAPQLVEALSFLADNPTATNPGLLKEALGQQAMFGMKAQLSPAALMLADFLVQTSEAGTPMMNRSKAFRQHLTAFMEKLAEVMPTQFFDKTVGEKPDVVTQVLAETLGVEARPGAVFGIHENVIRPKQEAEKAPAPITDKDIEDAFAEMPYEELQATARQLGLKANQKAGVLRDTLRRTLGPNVKIQRASGFQLIGSEMVAHNVIRDQIVAAFPGTNVTGLARGGWRVDFASGETVFIRVVQEVPIDWEKAERAAGRKFSEGERDNIRAAGAFTFTGFDGSTANGIGVMLLAHDIATDATVRHEALHLARQLGYFAPVEWEALTKEYSKEGRSEEQQEEDVAGAQEAWTGPPKLLDKLRAWFRFLMSKLGLARLDAKTVKSLMSDAVFWSRKPGAVKGAPSYQLVYGRPELANPGVTQAARDLVDGIDQERKLRGEPELLPDVEVYREATSRIAKDYQGEKANILKKARAGTPLDPYETLIAKAIYNREAQNAFDTGDRAALSEAQLVAESWRELGTEAARAFRLRYDPIETPAQRRARLMGKALFTPPPKQEEKIKKLRGQGKYEQAEKERQKWVDQLEKTVNRLETLGVRLQDLPEISQDPQRAARVLGTIQTAKADIWDAAYEWWLNAILSAPTTQVANITGNIGFGILHFGPIRLFETIVNALARTEQGGKWGEYKYMIAGILPGLTRGARNFFRSWKSEIPYFEAEMGYMGVAAARKVEEPRIAIKGKKGRIIRIPTRFLTAFDSFFKSIFAEMEVGAQAYRIAKNEGLSGTELTHRIYNLTSDLKSEAWAEALTISRRLAFQTPLGKPGKWLLRGRKAMPGFRYIMPFITTPANIFKAGLKMTPLATPLAAFRIARAVRTGDYSKIPTELAYQALAWAAVLALMSNDPEDPWITGAASEFKYGKRTLARRTYPSQSIKIGGRWISYARLEPFSTMLAIDVDGLNALHSGDPNKVAEFAFEDIVGQVKNKTFLSGIGDLMEALESENTAKGIVRYASNFGVSWLPNIARGTGRAFQSEYAYRGVWGKGTDWWTMLMKRTIQRTELGLVRDEPSVDIWGRRAPRGIVSQPKTDWLWRMAVPLYRRDIDMAPGDRVIVNWNNAHPEDEKFPQQPPKRYKDKNGETRYMTPAQYTRFLTLAGQLARRIVDAELTEEEMASPTEVGVEIVTKGLSDARRIVKAKLVEEWNGGETAEIDTDTLDDLLVERHITNRANVLARARPLRKDKRAAWEEDADEALAWFRARGLKKKEVLDIYRRYLYDELKTPEARTARFRRLGLRLKGVR